MGSHPFPFFSFAKSSHAMSRCRHRHATPFTRSNRLPNRTRCIFVMVSNVWQQHIRWKNDASKSSKRKRIKTFNNTPKRGRDQQRIYNFMYLSSCWYVLGMRCDDEPMSMHGQRGAVWRMISAKRWMCTYSRGRKREGDPRVPLCHHIFGKNKVIYKWCLTLETLKRQNEATERKTDFGVERYFYDKW